MTAAPVTETDTAPERTKTRLLELLKRHGPQTAQDLALRLQITPPAARRHLNDLQAQAFVRVQVEKPGGRGRPQYVFALTDQGEEKAFPKTYANLCLDVLEYLRDTYGEEAVNQVFQARNDRLETMLQLEISADLPLEKRLELLTVPLSELGFAAHVEEQGGQWYLVQGNCPTLQVARCFKGMCQTELKMYSDLLGVAVERVEHIACGQGTCRYRIGPAN